MTPHDPTPDHPGDDAPRDDISCDPSPRDDRDPPADPGPVPGTSPDIDDVLLLDEIRRLYTAADPVPPDLADLSRFAVDPHPADADLLRPRESLPLPAAAVRGPNDLRTLTFETSTLTIALTIAPLTPTTARLDGWIAPATPCHLTLRTPTETLTTTADPHGRFLFEHTPRGPAQLTVHDLGDEAPAAVSPALVL
ncbi:hypothetical protein GCM10009677_52630 [Sphaerisporangium rubeum]|uniref:Carboxypeptidase regulatory-like domain-containing protein n=1 Tax=Sphaerisporangium rubeum TaxID=321317 RepID=A0A7X0II39_9ACTN|nr:hypothetical protein [Sphaerisporangium rubeum]MBB6475631.1 hypothetical protein [Sphaerisporangium rubeum]